MLNLILAFLLFLITDVFCVWSIVYSIKNKILGPYGRDTEGIFLAVTGWLMFLLTCLTSVILEIGMFGILRLILKATFLTS